MGGNFLILNFVKLLVFAWIFAGIASDVSWESVSAADVIAMK